MSFLKFWAEAICASFSVGWGVLGGVSTAMPVIFYFIGKYWPPSLGIPWLKWCVEHQNELHVMTAAIFIAVYLVYAPFQLYSRERSLRIEAEDKVKGEPRIKLDVTDVDGRKEIEKLRKELNEAQKTGNDPETRKELETTKRQLEEAQATIKALDPTLQPIATLEVVATFIIRSDQTYGNHFMDSGGITGFVRGSEPLLVTFSGDSYAQTLPGSGTARFHAVMNAPANGPLVGKPMAELRTAEYLQIELAQPPAGAAITEGKATVTINGSQRFQLEIPAQIAVEKKVFARDLFPMRSKLNPK